MARKGQAIGNTKQEHKVDITPFLKGEDITDSEWTGREQANQGDSIWGVRPEALLHITEPSTKQNRIA